MNSEKEIEDAIVELQSMDLSLNARKLVVYLKANMDDLVDAFINLDDINVEGEDYEEDDEDLPMDFDDDFDDFDEYYDDDDDFY